MRGRESEIAGHGARLFFLGPGTAAMAAEFARQHAGGHTVLADPERTAFRAAGMRRGGFSLVHWRTLANAARALRRGFRQRRVLGDPWQQGGLLVLDDRGALAHQQVDAVGGDPLDLDAALGTLGR